MKPTLIMMEEKMQKTPWLVSVLLIAVLVLSACASPVTSSDSDAMMDKEPTAGEAMMEKTEEVMEKPGETMAKSEEEMMEKTEDVLEEPEEAMMESPAWFTVELTDVGKGEVFTVGSLKGKVILVETMAQWCSNCLRQQKEVKVVHERLGERDDFVSIGLDIDPNEAAVTLKDYIARNGFNWVYAVSPAEVSRALSDLYGPQFLTPPSTPMLIIDRQGEVHPLPMGIKSADKLEEALQPFLDEGM